MLGDYMKKISKYKVENSILILMIIMAIISIATIHSASSLIPVDNLALKQLIWYILGFIVAYFIMFIGNQYIYRHVWILYIIGIISLIAVLLFADPINGIRSWFQIPGIGNLQPSEFMKIILILTIASSINDFNENYPNPSLKEEFELIIKIVLITFIPSILTFMQPDTGIVLIYLIIASVMLFISGIRYRWFLIGIGAVTLFLAVMFSIYFLNSELFIDVFGTDFFLRIDRLLDWTSKSGYQLETGMTAIGSGGLFGHGFNNTPIYFPEPQTDFIFAVFASNFGLIGAIFLIMIITIFDLRLINIAIKNSININKYIIAGIIGMLLYQQIQNIGMTIGLLPITGITLPFISYGGSSLISYMIIAGIFFNISNESLRYTN
jgi:rod shape determining protein RodA